MLKSSNAQGFLHSVEKVTDDLVDTIREERTRSNQINNLAHLIGRWNIEGDYMDGKVFTKLWTCSPSDVFLAFQLEGGRSSTRHSGVLEVPTKVWRRRL